LSLYKCRVCEHGRTNIKQGITKAVRDEALHLIQLLLVLGVAGLLVSYLGESPLSSAKLRRRLKDKAKEVNMI
jgi:hypothetical protein